MTTNAIEARTLALVHLERAAGAAFGCDEDGATPVRSGVAAPTMLALATAAALVAATITYLV